MVRELTQFENYLVHEFVDDYVDGIMSRRDMMRRVLHITGGVATTATVLTRLGVKSVSAQDATPASPPPPPTPTGPRSINSVAADDPRITAADVTFPGAGPWSWYVMLDELGSDQEGAGGTLTVLEPMDAAMQRLNDLGGRLDEPLSLASAFARWLEAAGRSAGAG